MIRRGLFLALVGAVVAKAQSLVERRYSTGTDWDDLDVKVGPKGQATYGLLGPGVSQGKKASSITTPQDLKPRSGYCGACGTKGDVAGVLLTAQDISNIMNYVLTGGLERLDLTAKSTLRCPHCGTLFTETDNG